MLTALGSVDKKSKFSRKRHNEDEGDITYINERNRVFNKKVCQTFVVPSPLDADTYKTDCTLLRQVYSRDQSQFRAWYRSIGVCFVFYPIYTFTVL